jgi:hypothetical protein
MGVAFQDAVSVVAALRYTAHRQSTQQTNKMNPVDVRLFVMNSLFARAASAFFTIFLFVLAPLANATTFYVEPATGSQGNESALETTTELVKASVHELGHQTVASQSKAHAILRPKLLKLGESHILTIDRIEKGRVVYSTQLKAQTLDELDSVAKRVTRSAIDGTIAKEDARVGEITKEESTRGTERKAARSGYSFALGPGWINNMVTSTNPGYSFLLGYGWDVNVAQVRLSWNIAFQGPIYSDLSLGGRYFFSNRDITPYIGADLGLGMSTTNIAYFVQNAGFNLAADAGVVFLRTSSINLDIGLRYSMMLNNGNPSLLAIRLGIFWP